MSPQDPSDYMSQLSQMTMVEQLTALASSQKASNALQLLGRTVTYQDADGSIGVGKVESVDTSVPSLQLEGLGRISPDQVKSVAAA
jgi:flagellar hook assembly protein FlgD